MFRKFLLLCGLIFGFSLSTLHAQTTVADARAETRRVDVRAGEFDTSLENTWLGLYANGKKIGYVHSRQEKVTEKGETFYRATELSHAKLLSLGEKGEIKTEQMLLFAAEPPYALVRGENLLDDGKSQERITVEAKGKGVYEAVITVGKEVRKVTRTDLNYTLSDQVAHIAWLRKGPAVGETYTFSSFDFGGLSLSKTTMKMNGTKEIVHNGVKTTVSELEKVEAKARGTEKSVILFDRNGFVVAGTAAGFVELRSETEAEARKIEYSEDMIFANMVKLDRGVGGELKNVKGLVLRGKGKINDLLPQTDLQTIQHDGDDRYTIKIGKHHGARIKATKEEIEEGLAEDETHPIKDAKVIELAKKAIGDAKTDQEKAERLCKFVNQYIKYEIVYLPKVHDIIERKVGDCKSYALFFTTLARAVGLPARESAGYFYMGDEIKGFGGHAWTEVLLDGNWVPMDATIGLTELVPFYICVGTGRSGLENMGFTMGKLSFELVEVER